jgi:hypothetical protein
MNYYRKILIKYYSLNVISFIINIIINLVFILLKYYFSDIISEIHIGILRLIIN